MRDTIDLREIQVHACTHTLLHTGNIELQQVFTNEWLLVGNKLD